MTRFSLRSDWTAWVFGVCAGNLCGYLMFLVNFSPFRQRLDQMAPGLIGGFDLATLLSLLVLLIALLIVPPVTIALAQCRTFSWPLLPLGLFFGWVLLASPSQTYAQKSGDLAPFTCAVLIFAWIAWLPFSRTALFSGRETIQDDRSCVPRALFLLCRALGLRVSIPQMRVLTGWQGKGVPLSKAIEATASVGVKLCSARDPDYNPQAAALPALAVIKIGTKPTYHAIVLRRRRGQRVLVHDPNFAWEKWIPLTDLQKSLAAPPLSASLVPPSPNRDDPAVWPPAPRNPAALP